MLDRVATSDIAILGYGCRVPGANDVAAFWSLLSEGRCAVSQIGPDRWSQAAFLNPNRAAPGATYTAAAGVLDDIFGFDPAFFGISPREAAQIDPQQRLLMMVAWEAIERAGLTPARLAGARTGVYVGCSGLDYGNALHSDPAAGDAQFMTGNTLSIVSNRLAYFLDAQGPSYTIDTACSSSLFAFHAACEAIRNGEIDLAVVGGVNLLLSPMPFIGFSRAGMLSPQGLCRAFDAAADGYVRAEGAVAFVIGALDIAQAQGDCVRGVVVGSAVNSDGRAGGLSVPNGARQAALMRRVYGAAGVGPDDLAFIEAHGTGTAVGDPIEARAIGEALGAGRATPLPIGSVKSNLGHMEPASGLAGLLKAQLALEHGVLPATLHVDAPNPAIPFATLNLHVAREAEPLPRRAAPWVAGVNSFGFGGANAHVAIRQPTKAERAARGGARAATPHGAPLILSAASDEALRALAARWRKRLDGADAAAAARLAATAAHRRARLPRRLVIADATPAAQVAALDAWLDGRDEGRWVAERAAAGDAAPVAFVFSGNGSQWAGMGLTAYRADAAFRDSFDATAALVAAEGGASLEAELRAPDLAERLSRAMVAQPLLMALQMASVDALAARGVRPVAVAGHSVGEVAAAWASGALTRAQAARLAVRRARRQTPLYGAGGMAAVLTSADDARALIAASGIDGLDIAADNSPRGATVSGEPAAIDALLSYGREQRVALKRLRVDYPFHGPLMERIRAALTADLADMAPQQATVAFVSTTEGAPTPGEALDGGYWWRNARQPVLFRQAVLALADLGCGVFLEIGPQPTLLNYVADTLAPTGRPFVALPGMRRQGRGAEDFDMIAARVAAAGGAMDDAAFFGARSPYLAEAPEYPWRLTPYRFARTSDALNVHRTPAPRGLLGWRPRAGEGPWIATIDLGAQGWLADHAVDGVATLPAAAFAEIALSAGAEALGDGPLDLVDFEIMRPVTLEGAARVDLRTAFDAATGAVTIESRAHLGEGDWTLHAAGALRRGRRAADEAAQPGAVGDAAQPGAVGDAAQPGAGDGAMQPGAWDGAMQPGATQADPALYESLGNLGLLYGPAFRRAGAVRLGQGAGVAGLAPSLLGEAGPWMLDPTDLDAAFHVAAPLFQAAQAAPAEDGVCLLPVRIGRLSLLRPGAAARTAQARLVRVGARGVRADFTLSDAAGAVVARIEGVRFAAVRLRRRRDMAALFWRQTLRPVRATAAAPACPPPEWADAAMRLQTLGVTAATAPEPDAGALILDAMCRRMAWDAARALAPGGGVTQAARARLEPGARRALACGLEALIEDGAFDPDADRAAETPPCPALPDLVAAMTRAAPDRAPEMTDALQLAAMLTAGKGDARAHPQRAEAVRRAALWGALATAGRDLAATWPAAAPLEVLVIGAPTPRFLAALGDRPSRLVTASLSGGVHGDDADAEGALHAALGDGPFDAVFAADAMQRLDAPTLRRLAAAMAPSATLIAAEQEADLLGAMLAATGDRAAPADPLAARLEAAGLERLSATPMASGAFPALLISARRPTAAQADAAGPTPGRVRIAGGGISDGNSGGAAALRAALEAALARAGVDVVADGAAAGDAAPLVILEDALRDGGAPDDPATVARALLRLRDMALSAPDAPVFLVLRHGLDGLSPGAAALARARRTLANERPALRLTVLDPGDAAPDAAAALVARAVMAPGAETEIALGATGDAAPRIEAAPDVADRARRAAAGADAALALRADATGGLETLRWRPVARRAPGAGEIEIAVRATGLNFRDVMWAMGVLPEEAVEDGFAGAGIGMECAGVVTRAGPGARFAEGDAVIAFTADAAATHATFADSAAAPLPKGLCFSAAATLPVVFGTAWRGLIDLGRLQPGETVLVHGAAGGVGMAALQIARARGARVIATAGAPEKRALARMLGADAVFDSRSLDFADAVMDATGGAGVDVVLNSLSGEAMERSIGCLAAFGRFIELGKRDFYANTRIGLRAMRRNIAYFGVDLDAMLAVRPESGGLLLNEVAARVAEGAFAPLPHQTHAADDALGAFRLMQRSGHVGKIVLTPPDAPEACAPAAPLARADGAYLVVGGARGFGLRLAERLAARGARRLWLTSRAGACDAEGVARMRALGARVEVAACDAADPAAMASLMARIDADGAPLRGVAHAAMTLKDALIENLDAHQVEAQLRPKLRGAMVLDSLTRGRDLDFFILFSSIAAQFGNPGQAAYVAANAAVEAVAAGRRAAGLPALAAAFGPIGDAGVLAQDAAARERLERRGAGVLSSAVALDALELALAGAGPQDAALAIAPMRWGALVGDLAVLRTPLYQRVDRRQTGVEAAEGSVSLAAMIAGLDQPAAVRKLTAVFRAEAAIILRQPVEEVDPARPLTELGFDSLMGVELKLSAEEKYGAVLPGLSISDGSTLTTIAARVAADLMAAHPAEGGAAAESALDALAARHVDADVRAAIADRLAERRPDQRPDQNPDGGAGAPATMDEAAS